MIVEIQPEAQKEPNAWISMWTAPRGTIRRIVDTDPRQHVILLTILGGIANTFSSDDAVDYGIDIWSIPVSFIVSLIIGPIFGLLSLYIWGAIYRWIGSWFGGEATTEEVRAAIAWANIPTIWSMLLWVPMVLLASTAVITGNSGPGTIFVALIYFLGFVEGVIAIWAGIVFLKCLGEVHGFSAWTALGVVLIPGVPIGLVVGIVFAQLGIPFG
jgi:hypothetical protein